MKAGGRATWSSTRTTVPTASATTKGRSARHDHGTVSRPALPARARPGGVPVPRGGADTAPSVGTEPLLSQRRRPGRRRRQGSLAPPRADDDAGVARPVDEVAALLARPGRSYVHRGRDLEDVEPVGEH